MADNGNEEPQPEWYQQNLLNDPKYGDTTFQFDKKLVTAHSCVLCIRCRVLYQLWEKAQPKKKKERKGITNLVINQPFPVESYPITSDTFEVVMRYLYADDLQFETMSGRQALDLAIAAREFELPRLIRLCHDYLRKAIDLDNVHSLLKVAHDTKEAKVKGFCEHFASRHRKEFIGNKTAVGEIGVELFQDVMASLLSLEEEELETDEVPARTIVSDFKKLYADVDMGANPGDAVVNMKGQDIHFHKCFFASLSRSLAQSFQPSANGDENVTDIMKVKPALSSAESFRAILKYVYYGDISGLSVMMACEVQEFAKSHGMSELQNICEHIMSVTITTESCMSIMKVVFNPGNLKRPELANTRKNSLTFHRENLTHIELSVESLLGNSIVMAEIILAWQIAERAEREGVAIEDYCKKKGIGERRYSDINLAAAGGETEEKKDFGGSNSTPLPQKTQTFVTASPTAKTSSEKNEEEKKEEKEEPAKKPEKRGLFGRRTNDKKDKKKDKK